MSSYVKLIYYQMSQIDVLSQPSIYKILAPGLLQTDRTKPSRCHIQISHRIVPQISQLTRPEMGTRNRTRRPRNVQTFSFVDPEMYIKSVDCRFVQEQIPYSHNAHSATIRDEVNRREGQAKTCFRLRLLPLPLLLRRRPHGRQPVGG